MALPNVYIQRSRCTYARDCAQTAQKFSTGPEKFSDLMLALVCAIAPRRLDMPLVVDSRIALENFVLAYIPGPIRCKAIKKMQDLQNVLHIHDDLIEALLECETNADVAAIDSLLTTLQTKMDDFRPTEGITQRSLCRTGRIISARASMLGSIRRLRSLIDLSPSGQLTLETARMYCGELHRPAWAPLGRRAILAETGFPHLASLEDNWVSLQALALHYNTIDPGQFTQRWPFYLNLADTIGQPVCDACSSMSAYDLSKIVLSLPTENQKLAATLLKNELDRNARADVRADFANLLPASIGGVAYIDAASGHSEWHSKTLNNILSLRCQIAETKTHFRDGAHRIARKELSQIVHFVQEHAGEKYATEIAQAKTESFKWFVSNCDIDMVKQALEAFAKSRQVCNANVKSTGTGHNAKRAVANMLKWFKEAILPAVSRDISLTSLSTASILRSTISKRVEADGATRRTFTDEEIQAMFDARKEDPRWSLILRLLREIGLRVSCLSHMKYYMLLDSTHTPRHTCRVPEKQQQWRSFVTSLPLKQAIKRYAEGLRDAVPEDGDIYIFNLRNPHKPLDPSFFNATLKNIARQAGISNVVVHPHAFRHTIVGQLIDAGNSMDLVSKFMGHKSVATTAQNYWVPTTLELNEKLNNPFTGTFQQKVREREDTNKELEMVYDKLDASMTLFHQLYGVLRTCASQGDTAEQALQRFSSIVPNADEILKGIAESTSASLSVCSASAHSPGAAVSSGQPKQATCRGAHGFSLDAVDEHVSSSSQTYEEPLSEQKENEEAEPCPEPKRARRLPLARGR